MSVVKIVLASLVCLGLSLPAFAGSFEGVVVMKGTSDGDPTTQKTYFKGDKMRIDERVGDYTVWDATKKEGYKVNAKTRTVMVIPWRDVKPEDAKKMFGGMTVIKTGKSDKVAGYPARSISRRSRTITAPLNSASPRASATPRSTDSSGVISRAG